MATLNNVNVEGNLRTIGNISENGIDLDVKFIKSISIDSNNIITITYGNDKTVTISVEPTN